MIAARQELDLRPRLERLDRLICRSEGLDPGALSFAFRPLRRLDGPSQAALAASQATRIDAGLGLWPVAVTAEVVTRPNVAAAFAGSEAVLTPPAAPPPASAAPPPAGTAA